MKKILSILSLAGLIGAGSVQAQTPIYIDGSSAFKVNVYNACKALFGGNSVTVNAVSNGVSSSTYGDTYNSSQSLWTMTGTLQYGLPSTPVIIYADFNGSVQGIHSLLNADSIAFLTNSVGFTNQFTHRATFCFSDVDSSATSYPFDGVNYYELPVAVQPFVYVKSSGCPASVTNINIQQVLSVANGGVLPLSFYTGKASDATTNVYFVNRNLDSGTRVTTFADAAYIGNVGNWYFGGTNYYFSSLSLGNTIYGPGYTSGGNLAGALNATATNSGSIIGQNIAIGYLGLSDAKSVNGGLNVLSYNGVYPSSDITTGSLIPNHPAFDKIINGSYSYWAYECLDFPVTPDGTQTITGANLKSLAQTLSGWSGISPGEGQGVFTPGTTASIDADIAALQSNGTAKVVVLRLHDLNVGRSAVGGPISQGLTY